MSVNESKSRYIQSFSRFLSEPRARVESQVATSRICNYFLLLHIFWVCWSPIREPSRVRLSDPSLERCREKNERIASLSTAEMRLEMVLAGWAHQDVPHLCADSKVFLLLIMWTGIARERKICTQRNFLHFNRAKPARKFIERKSTKLSRIVFTSESCTHVMPAQSEISLSTRFNPLQISPYSRKV